MINKTHCWLRAVFVDFQCTPWHKTEAHFNGHVQKCPHCLETVRTPMQFHHSHFPECLDKPANFARRQLQATIECPVCQTSCPIHDTDTFANWPSSFRRNRVVEAPTLEARTEQQCNVCINNNPAATYCLNCRHFLCLSCFKFHQRCETSWKCFCRRIFDKFTDPAVFLQLLSSAFLFYRHILQRWEAKARG